MPILYINCFVRLSVCRGLETQIPYVCLSRSWNSNLRLSVCQGPETEIPSVRLSRFWNLNLRLSRSWNSDPICPYIEVLKPISQLSVCWGLETQISTNILIHLSSICRGPETPIPTNILIHLSSNIFVLGTYWNLFWKYGDFYYFFGPKMWSLCHFFFHKNHLYESYLIFLSQSGKKIHPKKRKKIVV